MGYKVVNNYSYIVHCTFLKDDLQYKQNIFTSSAVLLTHNLCLVIYQLGFQWRVLQSVVKGHLSRERVDLKFVLGYQVSRSLALEPSG